MNELMIVLEGGSFFYFPTTYGSAQKAFNVFLNNLSTAGINGDNIQYKHAILRDKDYEDIDRIDFKQVIIWH